METDIPLLYSCGVKTNTLNLIFGYLWNQAMINVQKNGNSTEEWKKEVNKISDKRHKALYHSIYLAYCACESVVYLLDTLTDDEPPISLKDYGFRDMICDVLSHSPIFLNIQPLLSPSLRAVPFTYAQIEGMKKAFSVSIEQPRLNPQFIDPLRKQLEVLIDYQKRLSIYE